jgi:Protein of unknown function (DUF3040)
MSLPAWQQRALERIEGALQASEPHLASMFAIFARLNASEPVGEEPLARPRPPRRRRLRSPAGSAVYAVVIIPVTFTMIVLGAVLGGSAHTARNCDAGYSIAGNSPLIIRPACQATGKATSPKTTSGTRAASCTTTALAAWPAIWNGSELALPLPAGPQAAGNPPGTCYKLPRDGGSVADRAPGT